MANDAAPIFLAAELTGESIQRHSFFRQQRVHERSPRREAV
jgi:hypothetical protein